MIYYVATELNRTVSDVSKRFKTGYVSIDVPRLWEDSFLNNFTKFWVDENNVLHRPSNLGDARNPTVAQVKYKLEGELQSLSDEINTLKSSTTDSSAFLNALNSKADMEAVNSLRDTLTAVNSKVASLPDEFASKKELQSLQDSVNSQLTPLANSLSDFNSQLNSKADLNSFDTFSSQTNSSLSSISSVLITKADVDKMTISLASKADKEPTQSAINSLSNAMISNQAFSNLSDNVKNISSQVDNTRSLVNSNINTIQSKANKESTESSLSSLSIAVNNNSNAVAYSLSNNMSLINNNSAGLTSKANIVDVNKLRDSLQNSINNISSNKADVDSLDATRQNLQSQIDILNTNEDGTIKNTTALQQEVQGKANKTDIDSLKDNLLYKADRVDLDNVKQQMNRKVDSSSVNSAINSVANSLSSYSTTASMAHSADSTSIDSRFDSVSQKIGQYSNTDLTGVNNSLSNVNSSLSSVNDLAHSTIDMLTQTAQTQTDTTSTMISFTSQAAKNDLTNVAGSLSSGISSLSNRLAQSSVVDLSSINNSLSSLSSNKADKTDLSSFARDLSTKASQADLDVLKKATNSMVNVYDLQVSLAQLETRDNAANTRKEMWGNITSSLANKADISVLSNLTGNISTFQDMLKRIDSRVDTKADKSYVDTLNNNVSSKADKQLTQNYIDSLSSAVNSLKSNPTADSNVTNSLSMLNANLNLNVSMIVNNSKAISSLNSNKAEKSSLSSLSSAVDKKLEAKDVQDMFSSYATGSTNSASVNQDVVGSLSSGVASLTKEVKDAANVIISIGDFNNGIRGRVEKLEANSSSGQTSSVDLSSYETKDNAKNDNQQIVDYVNRKIDEIMQLVKPAVETYQASVAASQAASTAASLAASAAIANTYMYKAGKGVALIAPNKYGSADGSVTADYTQNISITVDGLDINKNQKVTVEFSSAMHNFMDKIYQNGGTTVPKLTFTTQQMRNGETVKWYTPDKCTVNLVGGNRIVFYDINGNNSTTITSNKQNGNWTMCYFAVIKNITVENM